MLCNFEHNVIFFQMPETDPNVILFSLIALEKFAQTSENKQTIIRKLENEKPCPINKLEDWRSKQHFLKRQVGFCAQWVLDNLCEYVRAFSV